MCLGGRQVNQAGRRPADPVRGDPAGGGIGNVGDPSAVNDYQAEAGQAADLPADCDGIEARRSCQPLDAEADHAVGGGQAFDLGAAPASIMNGTADGHERRPGVGLGDGGGRLIREIRDLEKPLDAAGGRGGDLTEEGGNGGGNYGDHGCEPFGLHTGSRCRYPSVALLTKARKRICGSTGTSC